MFRTRIPARRAAVAVVASIVLAAPAAASAALQTQDLSEGPSAADLAAELAGDGVTISNVQYTGADVASGLFQGGLEPIGFEDGVVLTSGSTKNVIGPNDEDSATGFNAVPGDPDLDALSLFPTYDASVLSFDFVPDGDRVSFSYVFSSDEYNEYVHSIYNDVFAFRVNGENCALVPGSGQPVSINTINGGNPYGSQPSESPELYRNNDLQDGGGAIDTEMDGLTVVLTCVAEVDRGVSNTMRLAIADASDPALDSAVFLKADSLTTCAEDGLDALAGSPAEGVASGVVHGVGEPAVGGLSPELEATVHGANCDVIVAAENQVDAQVGTLPGRGRSAGLIRHR
jgi:hypothetical protein